MAGRRRRAQVVAAGLAALAAAACAIAAAHGLRVGGTGGPTVTIALPDPVFPELDSSNPMLAGTDGSMWISLDGSETDPGLELVGAVGTVTRLRPPGEGPYGVQSMVEMPDGSVWFTTQSTDVSRITPGGTVTRFPTGIPFPADKAVGAVEPGPDGGVWFDAGEGNIVELSSTGADLHVYRPLGGEATMMAADTAGHVWLFDHVSNPTRIAEMAADGSIVWIKNKEALLGHPFMDIFALAPDGSIWTPSSDDEAFVRIAVGGQVTLVHMPPSGISGEIESLAYDGAGTLWFATVDPSSIGSVSAAGAVTTYPQLIAPAAIEFGSDGALWITATSSGKSVVVRTTAPPPSVCVVPDLYGDTSAAARSAIQSGSTCGFGPVSGTAGGTVLGQTPAPGAHLAGGSAVSILLGQGKPGLPGTWAGRVTTDQCDSNGGTTPSNTTFPDTLRITQGANGQPTATIGGARLSLKSRKGASYTFTAAERSLTVKLTWPSVSLVLARYGYLGCGEVDTYGRLYRTADA